MENELSFPTPEQVIEIIGTSGLVEGRDDRLYGDYSGLNTMIRFDRAHKTLFLTMSLRLMRQDLSGEFLKYVSTLAPKASYECSYENYSARISLYMDPKYVDKLRLIMDGIVAYARENHLRSVCCTCGKATPDVKFRQIPSLTNFYCDTCFGITSAQNKDVVPTKPRRTFMQTLKFHFGDSRFWLGVLGGLLGLVPAFVFRILFTNYLLFPLTMLTTDNAKYETIYTLGWNALNAGVVLVFFFGAVFFARLLARTYSRLIFVVNSIFIVAAIYISLFLGTAIEIKDYLSERALSLQTVFFDLSFYVKDIGLSDYNLQMMISTTFTLLVLGLIILVTRDSFFKFWEADE